MARRVAAPSPRSRGHRRPTRRERPVATFDWRQIARRARNQLVEATLIPLVVFYVFLFAWGKSGGIASALVCNGALFGRRLVRRQRVTAMLVLGTTGLAVRTVVALLTGSVFIFFIQPILGTLAIACAFFGSMAAGRPLAGRFVRDVCGLPPQVLEARRVRASFNRVSAIWGVVHLVNAAWTVWFLTHSSLAAFVAIKTVLSLSVNSVAVAASARSLVRALRAVGVEVPTIRRRRPAQPLGQPHSTRRRADPARCRTGTRAASAPSPLRAGGVVPSRRRDASARAPGNTAGDECPAQGPEQRRDT
jgi:hypothetical protein